MIVIDSSELIKYNANTRGTNTGDCTARAISLAFNISYREARQALNQSAKENWRRDWAYNTHENVVAVIRKLGGGELHSQPKEDPKTVNEWAELHNEGTYIIWCSSKPNVHRNLHLVSIINGKVYDSWDSRHYYVLGYWEITSGIKAEQVTDILGYLTNFFNSRDVNGYVEYTNNVFNKIIDKNKKLKKLADEYNADIDIAIRVDKIQWANYNFKLTYTVSSAVPTLNIPVSYYKSTMGITFKPTMTEDEIEPFFDATFNQKLYFFIHNVINKIEDACEGAALLEGNELPNQQDLYWYDRSTAKSFKSLPYWVRALTISFYTRPATYGEYSDRVTLRIKMPSFDTEYIPGEKNDHRYFQAYNMSDLKRGLEEYKKTGDYERAYDIAGDY